MAKFGDVDLELERGGGAVFELSGVSDDVDFTYQLPVRGDVVLPANLAVAVVRGVDLSNFLHGRALAREAANLALDFAVTTGATPVFLDHHQQPEVVWWNDASGRTLRIVSVTNLTMKFRATAEVRDAAGNLVPPIESPRPAWTECLRFYRTSEASTDLFPDSFRNLYLAIELLLSALDSLMLGKRKQWKRA